MKLAKVPIELARVIAGCHSLLNIDGTIFSFCLRMKARLRTRVCMDMFIEIRQTEKNTNDNLDEVVGDPIETVALEAVGWNYNPINQTSKPGKFTEKQNQQFNDKHRKILSDRTSTSAQIQKAEEAAKRREEMYVLRQY